MRHKELLTRSSNHVSKQQHQKELEISKLHKVKQWKKLNWASYTYLRIYCMKQSPSWEANRFSASQEIPCILWNLKVHYHSLSHPPPVGCRACPPASKTGLLPSLQFPWGYRLTIGCSRRKVKGKGRPRVFLLSFDFWYSVLVLLHSTQPPFGIPLDMSGVASSFFSCFLREGLCRWSGHGLCR